MLFATPLERESRKWACGRESAPIDTKREPKPTKRRSRTLKFRSIWYWKTNGFSTTSKSLNTCSRTALENFIKMHFATPLERESNFCPKWAKVEPECSKMEPVPIWFHFGSILVPLSINFGSRHLHFLFTTGSILEQFWSTGTPDPPKWNQNGTKMEPKWNQMEPEWNRGPKRRP